MTKIKWHSGPPLHVGWWRVESGWRRVPSWRWWNGNEWSLSATSRDSPQVAGRAAGIAVCNTTIRWCDYWPENARVPRIDPR